MKHEIVDYKKHPPGFILTKTTMDVLLKQEKKDQLMALYLFYSYTSCWQQTLQIKATTNYTAKGMGWSEHKVQQVKKRLLELGLIKNVRTRNEKHITGHYIRVCYATPCVSVGVAEQGDKCLGTGSNKCLGTHSRPSTNTDSKTIIKPFDRLAATKLHNIILSKKDIHLNTSQWPNTFRMLRTNNKIPKARIKEVLIWYKHHIGEDYVPVAHCAKTFREKFTRIEDAMRRCEQEDNDDEVISTYRMGGDGKMGWFVDE